MKCFEFSAVINVNREIYVDTNIYNLERMLKVSADELNQMSQEELEELFMDKVHELDALALRNRTHGISYQDDIVSEEFQDLIVSDTEEVVD